jgi:hypothetical protein
MSGHTPASGSEDVDMSECAMVREARKRLRTCRELWPDNQPAWCEHCREAQSASSGHNPLGNLRNAMGAHLTSSRGQRATSRQRPPKS